MNIERKYIEKMAEGDISSFNSLFILYYPKLKSFISSLIKNNEDARDLSQDVFLKIWNKRQLLVEMQSFNSYLFAIAKNQVYDHFKKQIAHESFIADHEYLSEGFNQVSELVEAQDLELLIDIVIENMPFQRKKIFKMSRKEGLTNDQIASLLNISKRTVETHISKALQDIRKLLSLIILFFL